MEVAGIFDDFFGWLGLKFKWNSWLKLAFSQIRMREREEREREKREREREREKEREREGERGRERALGSGGEPENDGNKAQITKTPNSIPLIALWGPDSYTSWHDILC